MSFKLIAIDLDHTLLGGTNDRDSFLPEGIAALNQAAANRALITIATGRSIDFILELFEREKIHCPLEGWPHYIIADDCLLYKRCDGTFKPRTDWNENIQRTERLFFEKIKSGVEMLITNQLSHVSPDIHRVEKHIEESRGYVEIKFPDVECARKCEPIIADWLTGSRFPFSAIRVRKYIFIRHDIVSKGHTLRTLCKALQIPTSNVLAIGDSSNDLSMIDGRFGFIGAAPGNAEDEIKQAIYKQNGYVAKNQYGKGVAEIINTLCPLVQ